MKHVVAPSWIAVLRRGLAVVACLLVLAAASVHFSVEAFAVPAAGVDRSSDGQDAAESLPCSSINHHCCDAGALPRPSAGRVLERSTSVAYSLGDLPFPAASRQAPPVEPPRT